MRGGGGNGFQGTVQQLIKELGKGGGNTAFGNGGGGGYGVWERGAEGFGKREGMRRAGVARRYCCNRQGRGWRGGTGLKLIGGGGVCGGGGGWEG